jgi:hypothetical protein
MGRIGGGKGEAGKIGWKVVGNGVKRGLKRGEKGKKGGYS